MARVRMVSGLLSVAAALAVTQVHARADGDGRADEKASSDEPKTTLLARAVAPEAGAIPTPGMESSDPQKGISRGPAAVPATQPLLSLPFKFGMDYYHGFSGLSSFHQFSDGLWAGSSLAAPSVGYARWEDGKGNSARVAVGVGGMYSGTGSSLDQPVEAYWQKSFGGTSVTVGKYWLPFGSQEWEYESRPGVMLQWSKGPHALALSTNYNTSTHGLNAYVHGSRTFGNSASVGVSLGGGRGLTYNSLHDIMWGVDGMAALKGWRITGEYVAALHGSQRFGFGTARLTYERLGAWRPYAAVYSWSDQSGYLGAFHSQVIGTQFQLTPSTALDAAFAPGRSGRAYWLQLHTSWER